ncbi:hypothetical protein N9M98_01955 [Candidatus Pseudothioglobus singularis]|nr:hypothetical protein [Candidatus Pseudothioglobus singularis]
MRKILLILPFILFGCSKDSNFDGQFTISDIGRNLKEYITDFGEPAFNLLDKTGIIKFLEVDASASTFFIGSLLLGMALALMWAIGQLIFEEILINAFKYTLKDLEKEDKFQKDNHLGVFKRIFRWAKHSVIILTGLIWIFAILWLYFNGLMWVFKP